MVRNITGGTRGVKAHAPLASSGENERKRTKARAKQGGKVSKPYFPLARDSETQKAKISKKDKTGQGGKVSKPYFPLARNSERQKITNKQNKGTRKARFNSLPFIS